MEQITTSSFQAIGQCAKMQMLSWGEMNEQLAGVPYDIDFSAPRPDEGTMGDISIHTIMSAIFSPPESLALPAREEPGLTPRDWEHIEKQVRKTARDEEWEDRRNKKASAKKACKKIKKVLRGFGIDD